MLKRILLIQLICIIYSAFMFSAVIKAKEVSIGIYPPLIEVRAMPGARLESLVTVLGKNGDQFEMSLQELIANGESGYVETEVISEPEQKEWVSFSSQTFMLNGEENTVASRQIRLFINIPDDVLSGDYNLMVYAQVQSDRIDEIDSGLVQRAKIGIPLLITVEKIPFEKVPAGYIHGFNFPVISFDRSFTSKTTMLTNTGEVRFKTYGRLTVKAWGEIIQANVGLVPLNVLTGSSRQLQTEGEADGVLKVSPTYSGMFGSLLNQLPTVFRFDLIVEPDAQAEIPITQTTHALYLSPLFCALVGLTTLLVGLFLLRRQRLT